MCSNRTNKLGSVLSVLITTAVSGGSALAVFHFGEPRAHHIEHFTAQRHDRGLHLVDRAVRLGDRALRLRLDQRALAFPMPAFLHQHFAERLAPCIKQIVGGQSLRRRVGCF